MSLEQKALLMAEAVGADIGALIKDLGDKANLTTVEKQNLVAAINSINQSIGAIDLTDLIKDGSISASTAWSSNKLTAALSTLKQEIIDGAPTTYDTLKEIATYLSANDGQVTSILVALSNTVSYVDAQTNSIERQVQACQNIGIGNIDHNFTGVYQTSSDISTYVKAGYVVPGYVR